MTQVIVTTTINPPTKAIRLFDSLPEWSLVVIGDLKTPRDYHLERGLYMSPEQQEKYDRTLSDAIGWNCIQRRNFGLLMAREMKADLVAVIDDDNIPLDHWGRELLIGRETRVNFYPTEAAAFDPVGATNYPHLWHRGFPIQLLRQRDYSRKEAALVVADIQADFWNGDPDIDAICRIEHGPECDFDSSRFPMASNKPAPFNSQNTFLSGEVLRHYFLFPHIGRMDDIWASYYVQALGFKAVFNRASVFQQRNVHDLTNDMRQEFLGYENNLKLLLDLAKDPGSIAAYLPGRSAWAFDLYQRHFPDA
jgi:hypothetical protein